MFGNMQNRKSYYIFINTKSTNSISIELENLGNLTDMNTNGDYIIDNKLNWKIIESYFLEVVVYITN